jgi:hypothetical protein
MQKRSEAGSSATWVILFTVMTILFVSSASFGVWAFIQRSDYKNNSDKKAAAAVAAAEDVQKAKLEADFAEREKSPFRDYHGSSTFGSVSFQYPKTWSAYVDQSSSSSQSVDGYFYPLVVPGIQSKSAFSLRIQVVQQQYDQVLQQYQSQITSGKLRAVAFKPPKLAGDATVLPGTKLDGALDSTKQGSMVLMKVRDKTLKIWTESHDFTSDFNNTILATLTFSP